MQRDYNKEFDDKAGRQYAYNFDYDVMHHYFMKSFLPFMNGDQVLELGCFQGQFTKRLEAHFKNVTCVEAASDAIVEARKIVRQDTVIIHDMFETVQLENTFDNVVMTHVLEHLDDRVGVLQRVNKEWLSDKGRFFLVCPNANAPSRQIAVKMGLISHNAAVTPAECAHGHRITYSLDTLERDAKAAKLKVIHRSGIFFKALANFQWDKILAAHIVTQDYLEGCYQLGQVYPDLCSSIFLVCEKG